MKCGATIITPSFQMKKPRHREVKDHDMTRLTKVVSVELEFKLQKCLLNPTTEFPF